MKRNKLLFIMIVIALIYSFSSPIVVNAADPDPEPNTTYSDLSDVADNTSKDSPSGTFGNCKEYKYCTDMKTVSVYKTVFVDPKDGTKHEQSFVFGNSSSCAYIPDCIPIEDFPDALNSDGSVNQNYQKKVDEFLESAVKNGQLDSSSEVGKAIACNYCGDCSGTISEACQEKTKELIGSLDDDTMDSFVEPKLIGHNNKTDKNEIVDSEDCNGVCWVVNNTQDACVAGSDTSYTGVSVGDSGTCTHDVIGGMSTTTLDCEGECKAACKKISNDKSVRLECARDCMNKRAGTDESCPTCSQSCNQKCNGDSECATKCIKENCNDCVGDCCPGDDGYPNCSIDTQCTDYCCPGDPGYPICNDDDCTFPIIYEDLCKKNPASCKPKDLELPQSYNVPGSCGVSGHGVTYEIIGFADSCNLAPVVKNVNYTITYPGKVQSIVYAGQGVDWYGQFSGTATIRNYVLSTENITVQINIAKNELAKFEAEVLSQKQAARCDAEKTAHNSYAKELEKYEKEKANAIKSCKEGCQSGGGNNCDSQCSNVGPAKPIEPNYDKIKDEAEENVEQAAVSRREAYKKNIEKYESCLNEATSYKTTIYQDNSAATTLSSYMYIASENIKQNIDTVRAVEKNNGLSLYSETNNSLKNSKNFFVPSSISNGTSGAMIANGYSQYAGDLNANCPFVITNNIRCSSKHCLVYRPISLSNPFLDQDTTESRKTLGYWNDLTIDMFVLNNRGVNDYEVYNLTPMYSITLTPASIKKIRNYNRQTSYNDFNFVCEDGLYCKSLFLRHSDYNYIVNIDKSCGMSNDWYACDSEQLAANKDSLFNVLRR